MEGTNTEPIYFRILEKYLVKKRIRNNVRIVYLDRTHRDRGSNTPKQLFNFLKEFKRQKKNEDTVYCMVFDRDSYKNHHNPTKSYLKFIKKNKKSKIKMIVSSPCFELWLLMHKEDGFKNYILPNEKKLFDNQRVSTSYTYISKMVKDIFKFNPKSTIPEYFINYIDIALNQSKYLTSSLEEMATKLGENIGNFIEELKIDERNL